MSTPSMKDAPQALRYAFDDNSNAIKVAGSLVPEHYDTLQLTYNALGKVATIVYILDAAVIAVLTFTYNINDKLESVVRT